MTPEMQSSSQPTPALLFDTINAHQRTEAIKAAIELGLFTRDEMTWAFEFAGMDVRYDSEGLMGRGLYIGKHTS